MFRGPLERVSQVPNLRQHSLLSVKRLAQSLETPMRFYPDATVTLTRRGANQLISQPLRPQYGLLDIKVRHGITAYHKSRKNPTRRLSRQRHVARETLWSPIEPSDNWVKRGRAKRPTW